jgi:hypothetical protein
MTLPERADYSLTESALSPFPAEPAHRWLLTLHFRYRKHSPASQRRNCKRYGKTQQGNQQKPNQGQQPGNQPNQQGQQNDPSKKPQSEQGKQEQGQKKPA